MNARARNAFTTIAIALVAMLILGVATASRTEPTRPLAARLRDTIARHTPPALMANQMGRVLR